MLDSKIQQQQRNLNFNNNKNTNGIVYGKTTFHLWLSAYINSTFIGFADLDDSEV